MNKKLLKILNEINDMFHYNELTYRECLVIIYILKELIEKEVDTGVKELIKSTIERIIK